MSEHGVRFGGAGIPQTILPEDPQEVLDALADLPDDEAAARTVIEQVAADNPRSLRVWAALGDRATSVIESYAYYRVGYHRGLDALRQNGWRGSGYVRWDHPSNRPFLRCLAGLGNRAGEIGENDEAERCAQFVLQLEPAWERRDDS